METLKKQKNIRGDDKETYKCSWRRESNRQIFVETLKKQTNIRGDVKETVVNETKIFVETLKKQTNIRGQILVDVKETDK